MARSKNLSGKKNHDLGHWPSPACSLSSYLHNLTGIHTCTSSQMFCIFQRVFYFIDSTITETTTTKSRCSTDPGSQTISNCSGRRNKVMFFLETSFVLLYWFVIVTHLMFINQWQKEQGNVFPGDIFCIVILVCNCNPPHVY